MSAGYDSRPPEAPARLGRYVTVRKLGAGGMAEVFLARSRGAEGTDKLLVVKRILPAFASNPRFRAMFIDEARVALRLNHPNIVQVYGFESDGPALLLVMEHIDGPDLAALAQAAHARGERLPPGLIAWVVREIARGLHYAHERRDDDGTALEIVHRDVSPGNVLLSYDGAVKLGDFGIAKARLVSGSDEQGALKGKFAYMAPEQARTEPVDRRADVYSLGVVLGELLAGRPLFDNTASGADLLPKLRRGEVPDIHNAAPDAPEALRLLVAQMTAADRANRVPTARDVIQALTRYLRGLDVDWDAHALEQYIARFVTRAAVTEASVPARAGATDEAQTVAHVANRAHQPGRASSPPPRPPSRPPPHTLDTAALMRERVHVAVVVGRIVTPPTTVDTLDTRPLVGLIEALAFKADATLERDEDGQFTLVVGVVRPHVDHALRAARLALDIAEAAGVLAAEAGGEGGIGVALGVARGLAAAARGVSGTLLGFEVVDEGISFATSLAAAAGAGETLVAGGLYRLVRRAFVLNEHATRAGLGTRTWRLLRVKTRAERESELGVGRIALVGRDAELAALRARMSEVRDTAAGRGALVVGELGVGKSALVAAFGAECAVEGAVVLRISLSFGSAERAYGCVAQVLCDLLEVPEDRAADGAVLGAAIERAMEIAAIPSTAGQRAAARALRVVFSLADEDVGAEGATTREVLLVLRRLLSARALLASLLLVVDGFELVDRHSRAVLTELLRKPPHGAVLTLLVARDDDPLARDAPAGMSLVVVEPLPAEARGQLVARRLGADDVAPELLGELTAAAGGNPLMLLEVVEALSDRGRIAVVTGERGSSAGLSAARDGELPLPATLEEVLAARLEALPLPARTLLKWCALLDAEFSADVVEALAGEDGARALTRLASDGILVRARGRRETFALAHAALAKVARASIDPTLLPAMHARIAAVLERRPAARGAGAALVARHREAAGASRPAARAYLECAGAQRAAGQNREALEAYARVLHLTHDATDPEGFALRFAAHLGREEIARGLGRTRARRAELLALRAIAVDAKDPRLIARALARQARYKFETGLGGGIERDVAAAARSARRAGEPRTEAEARRVLALYLGQRGRYAEGIRAADEALAALEARSALAPPPGGSADDGVRAARTVRIEVLIAKGALLRQTGEIGQAIEVYAETHALLARHGPRHLLAHVLNNLGVACYGRGDYADALRLYLASIAVSREIGHRDRLGMALSNAGQAHAALGHSERALAFLRKSLEVFAALGGRSTGRADAHVALAEVHSTRGESDAALAELDRARATAEASSSRYDLTRVKLGEAFAALARGEHRAALASAEEAARLALDAGLVVYAIHARAFAAEGAAGMGDRSAALRFVDAVLTDPRCADPLRLERGDVVLAACERALRMTGDVARADALAALRQRRPSGYPPASAGAAAAEVSA